MEQQAEVTAITIENLVKSHYEKVQSLKDEISKNGDMLKSAYESDPDYQDLAEKVKDANRMAKERKSSILSIPHNQEAKYKLENLKQDLKEAKDGLSYYLVEYTNITKSKQLELFPGEMMEIVVSGKLKRSNTK